MAVTPVIPALETDSCRVSSRTAGLHRETLSQNETKQNPKQESDYYKMRDIIGKKKDPPVGSEGRQFLD